MDIITFHLGEHDWVPNNPHLPVIVYRQAIAAPPSQDMAAAFEQMFADNGWPPRWRDGVYDYHHYHSTAHEVLGIAGGSAVLTIGGPDGRDIKVAAGDAVLLPVGTGHRSIVCMDDFLVVGAYPEGQEWDICREAPSPESRLRMASLAIPCCDPVSGHHGPVGEFWKDVRES